LPVDDSTYCKVQALIESGRKQDSFTNLSINEKPSLNLLERLRSLVAVCSSHGELLIAGVAIAHRNEDMKLFSGDESQVDFALPKPKTSADILPSAAGKLG